MNTRVDPQIDFDWADGAPFDRLDPDGFAVRWTGEIKAPVTGRYTLGMRAATMFRIFVSDHLVVQGRSDHEPVLATGELTMIAGRSYPIRVEFEHEKYDALATLLWQVPGDRAKELEQERAEAVAAAKSAEAVVLALGLSSRLEGEEMSVKIEGFDRGDRTSLDLPRIQEQLLEAVVQAASGKPVVLVLLSGSALSVNWANDHVPAILEAWYPGQAGGTAVADVLFGNVSPSGRLPVTFYRSVEQLPAFSDYSMKARTYRYMTTEPLYRFGHGLEYSRFIYSDLEVAPQKLRAGGPVQVSAIVRNAGDDAARTVAQLYTTCNPAGTAGSGRSLTAFRHLWLRPGESQTVSFSFDTATLIASREAGRKAPAVTRLTISVGGYQPGNRERPASNLLTTTLDVAATRP